MKPIKKYIEGILDVENSGHKCPKCGEENSFVKYIDSENLKPFNNKAGKCSNVSCMYHAQVVANEFEELVIASCKLIESLEPSYFDMKYLVESEDSYDKNNFVQFLYSIYNQDEVNEVIKKYRIGTSDNWKGATVFWCLDTQKNLCGGKVMLYSKTTGKRSKLKGIAKIKSMDSILIEKKLFDESFISSGCLFGEHLLDDNNREVSIGLVESEKTAVIASILMKNRIWLATGGRTKLTKKRLEVLRGREVILYPDNDCFYEWAEIGQEFKFFTSKLVQDYCPEENADLADLLGRYY